MFRNKGSSRKNSVVDDYYDVVVMGAGFSGAFAVEKICKELTTARVALVDSYGLLSKESSSQNECFKMHTGVHYVSDRVTAETCLRNSVEMADAFSDSNLILDNDRPDAPSRRGRHYIVSNSHSTEYVKAECENLRCLYEELLKEFPDARKVFGEPENFIKYLEPSDYPYVAPSISVKNANQEPESISVTLGIETPECQINVDEFKDFFKKIFMHYKDRLSLLYGLKIVQISHAQNLPPDPGNESNLYGEDFSGYVIETSRYDKDQKQWIKEKPLYAKAIINCTWQNIDVIDSSLNFQHNDYRPCTIRAKLLIKTTVPPSLATMNTCIFSSGALASFTRVPESDKDPSERMLITYEPVTNIGHFPSGMHLGRIEDVVLRELIEQPTSETAKDKQNKELDRLSDEIKKGAVAFIPDLNQAEIKGRGIGFVKIFSEIAPGNDYLHEDKSPIHQRREDGVQVRGLCYVSFSGMKMTYAFKAAQRVAELMHRHCLIRNVLEGFVREIVAGVKKPLGFEASQKFHSIRSALQYSLRSHLLSKLEKYLILKCNVYLLPMTKEVSKWKVMTHTTQNVEHEDIMLHDKYPKPLDLGDLSLEDLERVLEGWRKSFTEVTTQNIANGYVDQINKWQSLIVSQAHEESPGMTLN